MGKAQPAFCRCKIYRILAALLLAYLIAQGILFAAAGNHQSLSDLFSKENVHILSGQTVGRLLVDKGDAVIEGTVTRGVVVVGGNVTLASGAAIDGVVLVIGGTINRQPGAFVSDGAWSVPPGSLTKLGMLFGIGLLLGMAVLFTVIYAAWSLWLRFRRSPLYPLAIMLLKRWPVLYTGTALVLIAAALTLFLNLAWETLFKHEMDLFDNVGILLIRHFSTPDLDRIMIIISSLGYAYFYTAFMAVLLLLFSLFRKWNEALMLLLCLTGGALLEFLLKHLFVRARPDMSRVVYEAGYSFPSGHAMVSLCFYGMLAYLISRNLVSWRWRIALFILALLLIVAIGVSRIYLGVHYPTDVLAGYAAGTAWLIFCIFLHAWRKRNGDETDPRP